MAQTGDPAFQEAAVPQYLSSEEGRSHSLQLIEQRSSQINDMTNTASICDVRSSLQDIQGQPEYERASLGVIPFEVLIQIFEWYLGDTFPTVTLALVCKGWRDLLRGTPAFWRDIRAEVVHPESRNLFGIIEPFDTERHRKRVELAKSTLLDVTLTLNRYQASYSESSLDLFTVVAKTKTERWRSLTLIYNREAFGVEHVMRSLFKGTFPELRNLRIICRGADNPFISLIEDVGRSAPILDDVMLLTGGPFPFALLRAFHHVTRLQIDSHGLENLPQLPHLEELMVFPYPAGQPVSMHPLPALPKKALLRCTLSIRQLRETRRDKVEILEISRLANRTTSEQLAHVETIDLPELHTLAIARNDFQILSFLQVPKLRKLSLSWGYAAFRENTEMNPQITPLLEQATLGKITLPIPTILHLSLPIDSTELVAVLRYWCNLQELSLKIKTESVWMEVASEFASDTNPLCPRLRILRLHQYGSNDDGWKELMCRILRARADTSLKTVEWSRDGCTWEKTEA